MASYYELLGVRQDATEDVIRAKLKEKKRIWTQRQNAPRPEQQQEASNNLRAVPEIEATLLNPQQRAAYDQQLRSAPAEQRVDAAAFKADDLIQEAWNLLMVGKVADALFVATRATEVQGSNPNAWALLGHCKALWGKTEDAIYEYNRAINLKPNEASFYFDLGNIYEDIEHWNDAMEQYQRATQIDPAETVYRAAIGGIYVKNDMFKKGIDLLEKCVQEEPTNEGYRYLLALAYAEGGYEDWTFVPPGGNLPSGYYATTNEQVKQAEDLIGKAERVNIQDSELRQHIQTVKINIAAMRKKRFDGHWTILVFAVIIGLICFAGKGPGIAIGLLWFLIPGILYIFACFTPQYRLNKRLIEGKAAAQQNVSLLYGSNFGSAVRITFMILVMPLTTLYYYLKNYTDTFAKK